MKRILTALALLALTACTDTEEATRVLQNAGFTEVKTTGYKFWSCSQDDFYHTGFQAKNVNGTVVTGTVCSGLFFKDSTIRY